MKIKTILMSSFAAVSMAQIANATPFPADFGLFIVDTSTGNSQYVPITGGTAHYAGSVGNYSVAISTGITIQGGANPIIDLDVAQATAGQGATSLQIYYSAGGFGPSTGNYTLNTFLGTGGPVTTSAYLSTANTAFGLTTSLGGSPDVAGTITVNSTGSIGSVQSPYSLTICDTITGSIVSMDSKLSVPDGGSSLMLLGSALSVAGMIRRKLVA